MNTQQVSPNTPGAGLIQTKHLQGWSEILLRLPKEIASDPCAKFVNIALLDRLYRFVFQECAFKHSTLNLEYYREITVSTSLTESLAIFKNGVRQLHQQRPENPYHSTYHTLEEVPLRLEKILDACIDKCHPNDRQVRLSSACAHDLLHSGVSYAQRLTSNLNISNEERAVIHASRLALQAGYHPFQVLEIQRQILATAFFQKPHQLGLVKESSGTLPIVNGKAGETFLKSIVARDYDPDVVQERVGRQAAQLLCLADVLVTDMSFENWIKTVSLLHLEGRMGQGTYPLDPSSLAESQRLFLLTHVKERLEAVHKDLSSEFVSLHNQRIVEYSNRVRIAGNICAGKENSTNSQSLSDAVLLKNAVEFYLIAKIPSVDAKMLDFDNHFV